MLGIADLHTHEAVAAAESAIAGDQPLIPLAANSSETESEEANDDESDDDRGNGDDVYKTCTSLKHKQSMFAKDDGSSEPGRISGSKKSKIVEMSWNLFW